MVRVVVSEKNPIDIVVGDSQMQKLFQGSIAEINQSIDALFLNEHAGRIAFQRGTAVPEPNMVTFINPPLGVGPVAVIFFLSLYPCRA